MEHLLRLRPVKSAQTLINKTHSNLMVPIKNSIRRTSESMQLQEKKQISWEDIIMEDYYQQSVRYHHLNGSIETSKMTKLDLLDFEQTVEIRNNQDKIEKAKKYSKLYKALCNHNFYLNELFQNYEFYESKSEYLKEQIVFIENEIDKQIEKNTDSLDIDQEIENILKRIDLVGIEREMLKTDVSLKLKV